MSAPDPVDRLLLRGARLCDGSAPPSPGSLLLEGGAVTMSDVCTEGAGYADVALRDAIRAGLVEGPRVVPSGPGLGITGGYLPWGFAPGVCVPTVCAIVDGPDAARREVRVQVSYGDATARKTRTLPSLPRRPGRGVDVPRGRSRYPVERSA